MTAQIEAISFLSDYSIKIERKVQELAVKARDGVWTMWGHNFAGAQSELRAYRFLSMLLDLCAEGRGYYEFGGERLLTVATDVSWCRDMIQSYRSQYQVGMACMLRDEMPQLEQIDTFLSYIQSGFTQSEAAQRSLA